MKKLLFSVVISAAAAASLMAAGQGQPPTQPPKQSQPAATAAQQEQVTVVGCVQRESDFRRAKDAGRGGVAGTGVGAANEFVLVNATPSAGTTATPSAGTTAGTATGTTFELTGAGEGKVASFVGKRVEIMGKLKPAETTASGRPTGGATAGPPPTGVDVTSKDLKLRELEVASVREASGSCPATE